MDSPRLQRLSRWTPIWTLISQSLGKPRFPYLRNGQGRSGIPHDQRRDELCRQALKRQVLDACNRLEKDPWEEFFCRDKFWGEGEHRERLGPSPGQRHRACDTRDWRIERQIRGNENYERHTSTFETCSEGTVRRLKAAILAAGRGERLWPLAEKNPKHLLPVGGEPLLQRTVRALVQAGVYEIIMVVQFEAEKIKGFFGDGQRLGCEISYFKQKRLGGTADAVRTCENDLEGQDRFLVV